jgi:hypothetical protein
MLAFHIDNQRFMGRIHSMETVMSHVGRNPACHTKSKHLLAAPEQLNGQFSHKAKAIIAE